MEKDKAIDRVKNLLSEDREARTEASMISRALLMLVQTAIEASGSPRISKAVAIGSAAYTIGSAIRGFYKLYRKSHTPDLFTIKITEDDAIFEIVEDWFMEALPEESQRSIYAHSSTIKGEGSRRGRRGRSTSELSTWEAELLGEDTEKDRVVIDYSFDGTIVQSLTIAGHEVEVYTNQPENYNASEGGQKKQWNSRSMNIVCRSVKARNDVLEEIEKQSQHLVQSQPRMYVSSRWGDWRKRAEIQPRSRNSVVLKDGQMDRILDYLNTFLSNREAFRKADIPFRTGILLHGDPGSGKSSTALAIANELKMNVYLISLSSLLNDEALNDCFQAIPPNSIIILEDIDIASAVKERDDDDSQGVTMSGMLNVLDGFQSPPGVITIMTTNRLDVLDPAIRRPGRVDLLEELNCLDNNQLRGLCEYFMGVIPENLPEITPEDGITSADVMGVIRTHLPDFENAADDMVKFVNDKLLTKQSV
jgi:DNA polymerase III delta prime subunit